MTTRMLVITVLSLLLPVACFAQNPVQPAPQPVTPAPTETGVWEILKDPTNLTSAAFLLSNVADAKTDWRFTGPITRKEYVITPAQRLGIAGGSLFVAYTIRHYYPKTAKPINVALAVATAYFAGRALANTYSHGTAATAVVAPATTPPKLAFAIRFRR